MGPISIETIEGLEIETAQLIEEKIDEEGWDDIHVEPESALKGFKITQIGESGTSPFNRSDITVYQRRDWNPPELDRIENIARWFPNKTLEIPLVEIEIRRSPELSDPLKDEIFVSANHVLQGIVHVGSLQQEGLVVSESESEFVFRVNDRSTLSHEEFLEFLVDHVRFYKDREVYSEDELREKISQFKPEVFHFDEVLNAYQEDKAKILIILLSVFFEGYIEELVSEAMEEARDNPEAGQFYKSWDFKEGLDACRFFGLIEENEYRVIDQIRDERNDYAHEHEKYHPDIESSVSESGTLEEAIELYEEIIGVEDSMLTDS